MGRKANVTRTSRRNYQRSTAQLVRAYRERSGLTLEGLAHRAGLPTEFVELVELGLARIDMRNLHQLAVALCQPDRHLVYDIDPTLV